MAKKHNEQEVLKTLYELEPNYTFRFEGGYKNNYTKNLHVTCKLGHEYITTYNNFVSMKSRCKQCKTNKQKHDEQEVLKILYELEPTYTFKFIDGYKGAKTKNLHIICNHGHEYIVNYNNFKQGNRCPHCSGKYKPSTDEALKVLQELEPEYSFKFIDGYKGALTKNLHVICNHGHEYLVTYSHFVNMKNRCPRCINHKSKPETEIIEYIKLFYNKDIEQGNRSLIKNIYSGYYLELDIYIPDIKVAIEFNGLYWHSDKVIKERKKGFISAKEYHEYKTNQCKALGIELIHIDEQNYLSDKQAVLDTLKCVIEGKNIL